MLLLPLLAALAAHAAASTNAPYGLPRQHTAHAQAAAVEVSFQRPSGPDEAQIAYQLQVLFDNGSLILDTGSVASTAADAGIATLRAAALAQLPPSSALQYRLRMLLSPSKLWSDWSAPARWHVGPRAAAPWPGGASWLCTSPTSTGIAASYLRTEFALPPGRTAASAIVHAIGLGQFRLFINGIDVLGDEFNVPGQTDWRRTLLYSTYEVAPGTLAEDNALGVILGNGMYNVPQPPNGRYTKWEGSFGARMLLLSLVITLDDGSTMTVASTPGGNWTATDGGPVVFSHEYAGEDFNATLDIPGWQLPGFQPAAANPLVSWVPASNCSAGAPTGVLRPSAFEAVSLVEDLPAINMTASSPPGTVLIDVGRNFAGTAVLSVADVPAGATLRVWPSETMSGGAIQQASGGTPMYWQHMAPASPPGALFNVTLAPTFSTYGWRWLAVQLLLAPAAAAADNGTITVLSATYGGNCAAGLSGDATAAVAAWCGAGVAANCSFTVCVCGDNACGADAPKCLPDPAQGCAKDFVATWRCTADAPGTNRSLYLPAEADNEAAQLSCGAPPPAPPTPRVLAARGRFMRAAAPIVGTWSSSSAQLNAIHAITLEAFKSNAASVLTDCPHRERLGWLEVSHLIFPALAFNLDIRRLWAKIALDTVDSQQADGMVPDIAPEYVVFAGGFRDSPEWGSAAVLNPAWLASWYGDTATLAATYNTTARYVDYLLSRRDASGLLSYGLGDWIPVLASPPGVTATGVLVQDLVAMAAAATTLGLPPAVAANYSALASVVGAAYEAAFALPQYPTQCAAGIALALGITAPARVAAAQAYLVGDVRAQGNVTTSGEIGNRYALTALAAAPGGSDAVMANLMRTTSPGYGWMLARGETALAESWTDAPGDSHLHAMYGHVDEYLYMHITGIQQSPGGSAWRRVRIAPALPRGLLWANASFDSPRGLIHSAIADVGGGNFELTVEVPPGVAAEVVLPLSRRRIGIVAGTRHVLRDRAR